jgi:hypothetical protein
VSETQAVSEVESAFVSGVLWLLVDEPRKPHGRHEGAYVGESAKHDELTLVHVMSKAHSGECRGYVLTSDGVLRLRLPCYTGEWAEMDAAVLARVAGARVVAPYRPTASGMAEAA